MSGKELPIFNPQLPITVEAAKKAGIPHSETAVLAPKLAGMQSIASEAVLTALQVRVSLLLKERECEELGRELSERIRAFSGDELLAYAERTQGAPE